MLSSRRPTASSKTRSPRSPDVRPAILTAGAVLEQGAGWLAGQGILGARLDARLLLEHALGVTREHLLTHPETVVESAAHAWYLGLLRRRAAGEPLAYLVGSREFYGRAFRTDRRALIPRPETELLVELGLGAVAAWRQRSVAPLVVDVGTGSGAVAVSLAAEAGVRVVGTDVSWPALTLACQNASALAQAERVKLVQADLLAGLSGPVHVILANLPYIPAGRELPREVHAFEPSRALIGGTLGWEVIERLLVQARDRLAPGAVVALEVDDQGQARPVAARARSLYPGATINIDRDAAGLERVVRIATHG